MVGEPATGLELVWRYDPAEPDPFVAPATATAAREVLERGNQAFADALRRHADGEPVRHVTAIGAHDVGLTGAAAAGTTTRSLRSCRRGARTHACRSSSCWGSRRTTSSSSASRGTSSAVSASAASSTPSRTWAGIAAARRARAHELRRRARRRRRLPRSAGVPRRRRRPTAPGDHRRAHGARACVSAGARVSGAPSISATRLSTPPSSRPRSR